MESLAKGKKAGGRSISSPSLVCGLSSCRAICKFNAPWFSQFDPCSGMGVLMGWFEKSHVGHRNLGRCFGSISQSHSTAGVGAKLRRAWHLQCEI